ncbi:hypothetical protein I316_07378 [Kwoniella heveanensis BCC8398]|uniref:Uncharacterized protein n=1 Tax=Kwoniella heveanensis BCC8398 TaxID=1296120 RepID=A0A1B9GJ18_9TREE|nr:hypothetical protein I316_07378 [Kwoniella heveanensis BCC8398]
MADTASAPPPASAPEPLRKKITAHEAPIFNKLAETLNELDPSGVFAFAGRLHLNDDEREAIKLFVDEKGGAKLRSFPLDEAAAKGIYEAATSEIDGVNGRLLRPEQFALTGKVPIPQWIVARLSNNYSEPLELRLEGMICLAEGDSIPLPERDAEADEAFRYGQFERHTGTLLLALPTTATAGGKLHIVKPQISDPDAGIPLTGSLDWSKAITGEVLLPTRNNPSSPARPDESNDEDEKGKWQIPWIYYEPPSRISVDEITSSNGHMFILRYKLRTTEEDDEQGKGGWLPTVDYELEVGVKVIKERLKGLLADGRVLKDGGMLGFGLGGYDFPEEEVKDEEEEVDGEGATKNQEAEDQSAEDGPTDNNDKQVAKEEDKEEEEKEGDADADAHSDLDELFPIRKITPEEEKAFLDDLPSQFRLPDRCLVKALEELGLKWEIGGVWAYNDDGEGDAEEDADGGVREDAEDEADEEGDEPEEEEDEEKEDDGAEDGVAESAGADGEDAQENGEVEKDSDADYDRRIQLALRAMSRTAFRQRVWGDVVTDIEVAEDGSARLIYAPQVGGRPRSRADELAKLIGYLKWKRARHSDCHNNDDNDNDRDVNNDDDDDGDNNAVAVPQEYDPTLSSGTWITPPSVRLFCVQGLPTAKDYPHPKTGTNANADANADAGAKGEKEVSTSKFLSGHGVKKDYPVYWAKMPNEYRIETSFRRSGGITETALIGLALFVKIPPAAER